MTFSLYFLSLHNLLSFSLIQLFFFSKLKNYQSKYRFLLHSCSKFIIYIWIGISLFEAIIWILILVLLILISIIITWCILEWLWILCNLTSFTLMNRIVNCIFKFSLIFSLYSFELINWIRNLLLRLLKCLRKLIYLI